MSGALGLIFGLVPGDKWAQLAEEFQVHAVASGMDELADEFLEFLKVPMETFLENATNSTTSSFAAFFTSGELPKKTTTKVRAVVEEEPDDDASEESPSKAQERSIKNS
jgi:hypothetical protein